MTDATEKPIAVPAPKWAVWRTYPNVPGCPDYLGSVRAMSASEAGRIGRKRFGCGPDDELDIYPDDED